MLARSKALTTSKCLQGLGRTKAPLQPRTVKNKTAQLVSYAAVPECIMLDQRR
jgi:hypothetical protein